MIIQQLSTDWQLIGDKEVGLWHTLRWLEVWWRQLKIVINRCANRSRTTFDAEENFLFQSNVQWIYLGLICYGLFVTKADQSIIEGLSSRMELINHKNVETYATTQRTSSKVTFLILVLYDFFVQNILSSLLLLCYNLMIMNKL
jgi:hypothetical protein